MTLIPSSRHILRAVKSLRSLHSLTEIKSQDENNNTAKCGSRASLWRSLTKREEEEGWEHLGGSEQHEQVTNYYQNRMMCTDTEQAPVESALDGAADTDPPVEGKSLYNKWATRRAKGYDQASTKGPLKPMHDFVMSSADGPFRHQIERMISSNSGRDRYLHRLHRPISAPMFWITDKADIANTDETQADTRKRQGLHAYPSKTKSAPKLNLQARVSRNTFSSDNEEHDESTPSYESKHDRLLSCKRNPRPSPTPGPVDFSPEDIPLFDVNTLKKQYVFSG